MQFTELKQSWNMSINTMWTQDTAACYFVRQLVHASGIKYIYIYIYISAVKNNALTQLIQLQV